MSRTKHIAVPRKGTCGWSDHGETCYCRPPDPDKLIRAQRDAEMKAESEEEEEGARRRQ
jgi:hypothetical protein